MANKESGLIKKFKCVDFSTLMPFLDEKFGGIGKFRVYGVYMGYDKNAPRQSMLKQSFEGKL